MTLLSQFYSVVLHLSRMDFNLITGVWFYMSYLSMGEIYNSIKINTPGKRSPNPSILLGMYGIAAFFHLLPLLLPLFLLCQ